jgi:HSP20 family protein
MLTRTANLLRRPLTRTNMNFPVVANMPRLFGGLFGQQLAPRNLLDPVDDFKSMYSGDLARMLGGNADMNLNQLSPILSSDLIENDTDFKLHVDLPGVKKEDLVVNVSEEEITVKGVRKAIYEESSDFSQRIERSFGKVSRTFPTPKGVNAEDAVATFEDGVLEIVLKKKDKASLPATHTLEIGEKKQTA